MHLFSLSIRALLNRQGVVDEAEAEDRVFLVQQLTYRQWAWKVFPVAAASGLEVSRRQNVAHCAHLTPTHT